MEGIIGLDDEKVDYQVWKWKEVNTQYQAYILVRTLIYYVISGSADLDSFLNDYVHIQTLILRMRYRSQALILSWLLRYLWDRTVLCQIFSSLYNLISQARQRSLPHVIFSKRHVWWDSSLALPPLLSNSILSREWADEAGHFDSSPSYPSLRPQPKDYKGTRQQCLWVANKEMENNLG